MINKLVVTILGFLPCNKPVVYYFVIFFFLFTVGRKPTIKSKIEDIRISDKVTAIELDIGSNLTLVGGSSVSIFCKAEGVPDPAISWLLNGNQMFDFSNKTVLMVKNPDLLNLQTVSCSAVNFLGAEIQESYFTILGK